MFEIKKTPIGQFDCYKLINTETDEYLEVLTEVGAGLNDLVVKNGAGELVSVISGYRSEEEIQQTHHTKFRGSKLSPFPNRVFGGKYSFNAVDYQLPVNEVRDNNNLHAFLHNRSFEVVESLSDDSKACLKLIFDYKGTEQGYPFPYKLLLDLVYDSTGIEITTSIENTGNSDAPLGDGWHPYFKYKNIDKVNLKMGASERVSSLTGNKLSDHHGFEVAKPVGNADFDDCFKITSKDEKFEVSLEDENSKTRVVLWQENEKGKYQYSHIFTPTSRDEIAIEPVTCPPNALNTKESLIVLKPGQKTQMKMGIEFSGL